MKLTLRQLKSIIGESLQDLPPRGDVESQLQDTRFDSEIGPKVLSMLSRKFPPAAKLHLQTLATAVQAYQSGKGSWTIVLRAIDRLYSSQGPQRRSSYTGLSAVRGSSRPPSA